MRLSPHEIPLTITVDVSQTRDIVTLPFFLPTTAVRVDWKLIEGPPAPYVIDLGLKDPTRVRGWSGGTRTEGTLTLTSATPGYLPGSFPAGSWCLLLGLYRLPPGTTRIRVIVTWFEFVPQWLRGDLHTHTEHSDGVWTVRELLQQAAVTGLDFVATTDHNTASQNLVTWQDPTSPVIRIPGMEWTTYSGHANILGLDDPLPDWRVNQTEDVIRLTDQLKKAGALVSVNHPYDEFQPGLRWDWGDDGIDLIEVWNGPWRPSNQAALDHWQERLGLGSQVVAIGGSDTHGPSDIVQLGTPTTWVWTESPSISGILQSIAAGHLYITQDPKGPTLSMQAGRFHVGDRVDCQNPDIVIELGLIEVGDRIRLINESGIEYETLAVSDTWSHTIIAQGQHFIRLEVHRYRDVWQHWLPLLISNPIYLGGSSS